MNWLTKIYKSIFHILPKEGSYIELINKGQYETIIWKGIVGHHLDGKHFYIKTSTSILCSIKP